MANLSERLRKEIERQDLTIESFGKRWGISNGTLYSLLAGGAIGSLSTARKLRAAGVRLPAEDLLSA